MHERATYLAPPLIALHSPRQILEFITIASWANLTKMRLLKVKTRKLELFLDDRQLPPYAILSHTWEKEEIEFEDIQSDPELLLDYSTSHSERSAKIRNACRQADIDGHQYIWIDTCCINKPSDSELSEAINSMYKFNERAAICFAYLFDVVKVGPTDEVRSSLAKSKWFTRGWTLQELIAPLQVRFFSSQWYHIGTKSAFIGDNIFCRAISTISSIELGVLIGSTTIEEISVARKMSWASRRETTGVEDRAYSLLGLFGVNMPMLYGEGRNSFRRLQEEIIKYSTDETIFLWRSRRGDSRIAFRLIGTISR
jgi:hypothetical protein